MLWFLSGDVVAIRLDFIVDTVPVVADTNSLTYWVRDSAGTILSGPTTPSVTGATSLSVSITNGTVTSVEKRSVDYKFIVNGMTYRRVIHYLLTPWVNFTAVPAEVRAYLGISVAELPDEDVDLLTAYLELCDRVTKTALDTELAQTGIRGRRANRAVMLQAAIDAVPSLQLRLAQSEQSDTDVFERLAGVDLNALAMGASFELSSLLLGVTGGSAKPFTPLVFSAPTDPVTNT